MFLAKIEHKYIDFEPFLSSESVECHYSKHHSGYANNLNELIKGTLFDGLPLEEIIIKSRGVNQKVFNNASQLFNHDFYWKCMAKSEKLPNSKLKNLIDSQFDDFDKFRQEYIAHAGTMFGSGWSWLILEDDKLKFLNTANAENPVGTDAIPLCVIDLWEHAYYIDYRSNRADYIKNFVMHCIDWEFCESLVK